MYVHIYCVYECGVVEMWVICVCGYMGDMCMGIYVWVCGWWCECICILRVWMCVSELAGWEKCIYVLCI